jgi:hypothetical protein
MRLLDRTRAEAAAIVARARLVRVHTAAIDAYAASLPVRAAAAPIWDQATHYTGPPAATRAYVVTLDALNFGSGYFPTLAKPPGVSGYFLVARSLKAQFDAHGPWTAAQLQHIGPAETTRIFGQAANPDPAASELMGLFATALNHLGSFLVEHHAGSFEQLIDAADSSAEQLATLLLGMPFYQDAPFYKRAQITGADLALAGVASFHDLDRLTIFADNLVPHVLRLDGILAYDADLLARIARAELLPSGSPEEIEIRASALHAVELIKAALPDQQVTAMQLDNFLWNRGQGPAFKAVPRHRTRSVFY